MGMTEPHDDAHELADKAAPALDLPPVVGVCDAGRLDRFQLAGTEGNLWFERRSDVLIVSFDNLATVDEGWPRGPWLGGRIADMGYSVLGVQSFAKDWFRQATAPTLLRALEETGFFKDFRRVIFMGASMGGFAALNFAPLVAEARVLAFSPQSTMNKVIAPYEHRFPFSVRKSNWDGMPFLDAAAAVPYIRRAVILYDPFVPEDKAHAARMTGPNVQQLRLGHATHEAIRVVLKSGCLPVLLHDLAERDAIGQDFWRQYRGRRDIGKWQRAVTEAMARGDCHPRLTVGACDVLLKDRADLAFARRARRHARGLLSAAPPGQ